MTEVLREPVFDFAPRIISQGRAGCVDAATRVIAPRLKFGITNEEVLELLGECQEIGRITEEGGIHMLSVAVKFAERGYKVLVHTAPAINEYRLPSDAEPLAVEVHNRLVEEVISLSHHPESNLSLHKGRLDPDGLAELFRGKIQLYDDSTSRYKGVALLLVNWSKWANISNDTPYMSTHIVAIAQGNQFGKIKVIDSHLPERLQERYCTFEQLHSALDDTQQMIIINNNPPFQPLQSAYLVPPIYMWGS